MFKKIIIVMSMVVFVLADGPVLQTGQVKSYNANGDVVTDGSIKDDGYYQAGVTRSYGRDGDIVIDNATGLQWEDNETVTKPWDAAVSYCSEFSLGDNLDWRLPKIEELETLIYEGESNPALMQGIFQKYISSYYWSSATVDYRDYRRLVGFIKGLSSYGVKTNNQYIRCVRGDALTPSNFNRSGDIITDSITRLQWQDNSTAQSTQGTWEEAMDYCGNTLDLGGNSDWRLPNRKELLSIADRSVYDPTIDELVFLNYVASKYWSSTTYLESTRFAWYINFSTGQSSHEIKSTENYIRCVRGGHFGHLTCPEGKHLIQGERVCIPGTPAPDPGVYPPIADRNYIQGNIYEAGNRTEDIGWLDPYPPLCPPGQIRGQQGAGCIVKPVKDPCEPQEGMAALPIDCWEPQPKIEPKDIDGDAHLL